jgi:serine protease inhibitor
MATSVPTVHARLGDGDRPLLFAVRDVPTGAVVFLGRIGDPSARR